MILITLLIFLSKLDTHLVAALFLLGTCSTRSPIPLPVSARLPARRHPWKIAFRPLLPDRWSVTPTDDASHDEISSLTGSWFHFPSCSGATFRPFVFVSDEHMIPVSGILDGPRSPLSLCIRLFWIRPRRCIRRWCVPTLRGNVDIHHPRKPNLSTCYPLLCHRSERSWRLCWQWLWDSGERSTRWEIILMTSFKRNYEKKSTVGTRFQCYLSSSFWIMERINLCFSREKCY